MEQNFFFLITSIFHPALARTQRSSDAPDARDWAALPQREVRTVHLGKRPVKAQRGESQQRRCDDDARDRRRLKSNKRAERDFPDVYICVAQRGEVTRRQTKPGGTQTLRSTLQQDLSAWSKSAWLQNHICLVSGQYRFAPRPLSRQSRAICKLQRDKKRKSCFWSEMTRCFYRSPSCLFAR